MRVRIIIYGVIFLAIFAAIYLIAREHVTSEETLVKNRMEAYARSFDQYYERHKQIPKSVDEFNKFELSKKIEFHFGDNEIIMKSTIKKGGKMEEIVYTWTPENQPEKQ